MTDKQVQQTPTVQEMARLIVQDYTTGTMKFDVGQILEGGGDAPCPNGKKLRDCTPPEIDEIGDALILAGVVIRGWVSFV